MCSVKAANSRVLSPIALPTRTIGVENGRPSATDGITQKISEYGVRPHFTVNLASQPSMGQALSLAAKHMVCKYNPAPRRIGAQAARAQRSADPTRIRCLLNNLVAEECSCNCAGSHLKPESLKAV